jgi:hypothetical protein
MLIVAILAKVFTPDSTATKISSPTAASIAMIYLEAASYNMSWVCYQPEPTQTSWATVSSHSKLTGSSRAPFHGST